MSRARAPAPEAVTRTPRPGVSFALGFVLGGVLVTASTPVGAIRLLVLAMSGYTIVKIVALLIGRLIGP